MKKFFLMMVVSSTGLMSIAQKGTISSSERSFLANNMETATEQLADVLSTVDENEWTIKPPNGGWSVAECFEHIVMAMPRQVEQLQTVLSSAPDGSNDLRRNDGLVFTKISDRGRKFPTPLEPQRGDMSQEELWQAYNSSRAAFLEILNNKNGQFRTHFGQTPFGEADAYQIMILIPGHVLRHVNQMREVLSELRS